MTRDQKKVLRNIAIIAGMKLLIYTSICYAARHYRKVVSESDPT